MHNMLFYGAPRFIIDICKWYKPYKNLYILVVVYVFTVSKTQIIIQNMSSFVYYFATLVSKDLFFYSFTTDNIALKTFNVWKIQTKNFYTNCCSLH